MDLAAFERSLADPAPPDGADGLLLALWHAGRGAWDAAHDLVQHDGSRAAAWIHAWLHRGEGDLPNADFWYAQAGRAPVRGDLRAEWRRIAGEVLARR